MKIYCKDCKRFDVDTGVPGCEIHIERCTLPISSNSYKKHYKERIVTPSIQNQNNNCHYFQPFLSPFLNKYFPGIAFVLYGLLLLLVYSTCG